MKIAIGSDHRGFEVKQRIILLLEQLDHIAIDFGTTNTTSVDYPDYAFEVAQQVSRGAVDRGILICATGIGMSIAANKVNGIRAVACQDALTCEMSRRHNSINILCLSADMLGEELIDHMVKIFLNTEFDGGRHSRRVDKITRFEAQKKTMG